MTRTLLGIAALAALSTTSHAVIYQLNDTATGDGNKSAYPLPANVAAGTAATPILTAATHSGWAGINDTFEGKVVVTFTLDIQSNLPTLSGNGAVNLDFYDNIGGGTARVIAIGNGWWTSAWSYWKAPRNADQIENLLNAGGSTVVILDSQTNLARGKKSFVFTINFAPGAMDTGTIEMDGGINIIPPGNYSFNEINAGTYNAPTTFSDMTVEVIPASGGGDDYGTWAGYTVVDAAGNADTGDWMGWVNTAFKPYIWNYGLSCYMYIDEMAVTDGGSWVYIFNY